MADNKKAAALHSKAAKGKLGWVQKNGSEKTVLL